MPTFNLKGNSIKHHKGYSAAGWATLGILSKPWNKTSRIERLVMKAMGLSQRVTICVSIDHGSQSEQRLSL